MKEFLYKVEEFELCGSKFEAEIINEEFPGILYGKYSVRVKRKNEGKFGDVGEYSPSVSIVNGEIFPHRKLYVGEVYRKLGVADWMYDKLEKLNDISDVECLSVEGTLIDFYLKKGFDIVDTRRDEINSIDYCLLKKN